jgi:hypothetical protein
MLGANNFNRYAATNAPEEGNAFFSQGIAAGIASFGTEAPGVGAAGQDEAEQPSSTPSTATLSWPGQAPCRQKTGRAHVNISPRPSYLRTAAGWRHLTVLIDLFSRVVVGGSWTNT